VRIVSSGLIWNEGHPADGGSALSRFFDDRPFKAALWFQAAGDTRGQAWSGLFRDADGNGVMEFTEPDVPLPKGAWTNELNFLAWQHAKQGESLDLPAKVKLRFSLQWREAHDPGFADAGKDVYRDPLANLKLVLVYQPDPDGKQQPADDVQVVAESSGIPLRLEAAANAATYEQTLTFAVTKPGRYALRIEGRIPSSIRPAQYPTLPAMAKTFELHPRLFVETLDGPGRAVLHTYTTEAGSIGVPGDAHNVITIGAADARGELRAYSARGPAQDMEMHIKPDLLVYDEGAGTTAAASFAAGIGAATRTGWDESKREKLRQTTRPNPTPFLDWLHLLRLRPGAVLHLSGDWPQHGMPPAAP
jgi:hypothetical protein